jgi:hypothetical protein
MSNEPDWRAKGGKATSKKKTRACRRNAKQPRPGRSEFNRMVRDTVATPNLAAMPRSYMIDGLRIQFGIEYERAAKILDAAIKRQKQ